MWIGCGWIPYVFLEVKPMRLVDRFIENEKKRGSKRSPRFLARATEIEKLCRS